MVLLYLSPPQLECTQLWINKARILQDFLFILVTLVERIWGLTNKEIVFARLRIYRLFIIDWIQHIIPDLCLVQIIMV